MVVQTMEEDIMADYPKAASGVAVPASNEDLQRDELGYTNPNLHRRVDEDSQMISKVGVYDGIHSFRTVDLNLHDEESTTCEIP